MPKTGKSGRRPRRETPMPRSAFTAATDEIGFLLLLGEGNLSEGVQRLIGRAVQSGEEMPALMGRARRMVAAAERRVKPDAAGVVQQKDVYQYMRDHYWELTSELDDSSKAAES